MKTIISVCKIILFIALIGLSVSCADKQPPASWTDLGNDKKAWLVDSTSSLLSKNNYRWDGDFIENLPHGAGTLKCTTKDNDVVYAKSMNAYFGCLNSEILNKISNGSSEELYWGDSDKDGRQGFGAICQKNLVYIGDFEDGDAIGKVSVYDNEKLYYKGELDGLLFDGEGTIYYPDGEIQYCGGWKNSKRHGYGTEYYEDGNILYVGNWKNDTWNGYGTYVDSLGENISHVWKNGEVKERYNYYYNSLDSHKNEISNAEYNSTKGRILFFERFEIWLIVAVVCTFLIILVVLIYICRKEKRIISSGYYKDKHSSSKAYLLELVGGAFGFHYAYLASWSFIIHWSLSLLIVLSTFQFLMFPASFWIDNVSLLTKIPAVAMAIILLSDLIGIPYRAYVLKCKYYRHDFYEMDILNGRKTDLEQVCENIKTGMPQLSNKMSSLVNQATSIGNRSFVPDESGFKIIDKIKEWTLNDGSIEFEISRLEELSVVHDNIEEIFMQLEDYNEQLSEYLEIERISAMKNLICAKDLMGTIKKIGKSQEQILVTDTHSSHEGKYINIDNSLYEPVHIDFDAITRNCSAAIANLKSMGIDSTGAKIVTHGLYFAAGVIDNALKKKRKKQAIQKAIVDVVMSIKESGQDFTKSKAEILRYDELLSALFVANRAFIFAYCELRDTIYTETNFFNFLFHRVNRRAIKKDREKINVKLAALQKICSDYNRINKTTL